jgi:DNA-binding transcriptional regulator YiaG
MSLSFRNVDADPSDPIETWPYEAMVAAIERGTVHDWAKITAAVRRDPWGDIARGLDDYLRYAEHSGVTELLRRVVRQGRVEAEAADREAVAARIRQLIRDSGLTAAQLASRAGTSASRLSTYASGKVVPSAAIMLRLERAAGQRSGGDPLR